MASVGSPGNPAADCNVTSLGSPYALLMLLYGATADAVELEADWDTKQAANIATACHKSEEEAGERAVTQRIHDFFRPHAEGH